MNMCFIIITIIYGNKQILLIFVCLFFHIFFYLLIYSIFNLFYWFYFTYISTLFYVLIETLNLCNMTYIAIILKEILNLINYLFITIIIIYLNKKTANFLRNENIFFIFKIQKKNIYLLSCILILIL